jgi:ABC-type transporter Mla MlaB component
MQLRASETRASHWPGECTLASGMLRITHAETETEQRLILCGQLTSPWVAELRACWQQRRQVGFDAPTIVDLSDVTFIDESGEKLLSEMGSDGVEFVAVGVETVHLLENLKGTGERSLRRFIGPPVNQCEICEVTKSDSGK